MAQEYQYAYFEDHTLHNTNREQKQTDWIEEALACSSRLSHNLFKFNNSIDSRAVQPSSKLNEINATEVHEHWPVQFNNPDGLQFGEYFLNGAGSFDHGLTDDKFAAAVPWDPELFKRSTDVHHQARISSTPAQYPAVSSESYSQVVDIQRTRHTTLSDQASTEESSIDSDSDQDIGAVLKNGKYRCNVLACAEKIYKRPAELRRHYNTIHAAQKPEFWCQVMFCNRSAAAGGKTFHRKYRLQDHMRKMHADQVNTNIDIDMCEG